MESEWIPGLEEGGHEEPAVAQPVAVQLLCDLCGASPEVACTVSFQKKERNPGRNLGCCSVAMFSVNRSSGKHSSLLSRQSNIAGA